MPGQHVHWNVLVALCCARGAGFWRDVELWDRATDWRGDAEARNRDGSSERTNTGMPPLFYHYRAIMCISENMYEIALSVVS